MGFFSASVKFEANTGTFFSPQGLQFAIFSGLLRFNAIKIKLSPWFISDKGACGMENLDASQGGDLNQVYHQIKCVYALSSSGM